ncbi:MAG: nitrilase-related carbon-nitrogen hydrolase, partial [Chloroflexota bacterium]
LMRTYAQLTTSFVVFCNRVGVDESISFWGGSEVIGPNGQAVFSAPLYDEGLFVVEVSPAEIRRERIALPLLRDERLELQVRELSRIVAERAGLAFDTNAEPGAEAGFDLLPAEEPSVPIGFGRHGKQPAEQVPATPRRARPAVPAPVKPRPGGRAAPGDRKAPPVVADGRPARPVDGGA